MHFFLKSLLSAENCQTLNEEAVAVYNDGRMLFEGVAGTYYGNSFGLGGLPAHEGLLHALTPHIKTITGYHNIVTENSFTRLYFNGAELRRHKDRPGLDLTLSICTYSTIEQDWPLYCELQNGEIGSFVTNPGDGVLILGTAMDHWRDSLVCKPDQFVIQSFYHWKINS
jgi:hypothetical protein